MYLNVNVSLLISVTWMIFKSALQELNTAHLDEGTQAVPPGTK